MFSTINFRQNNNQVNLNPKQKPTVRIFQEKFRNPASEDYRLLGKLYEDNNLLNDAKDFYQVASDMDPQHSNDDVKRVLDKMG